MECTSGACAHHHEHNSKFSEKTIFIIDIIRIFISSLLTGISYIKFIEEGFDYISLILTICAYILIGYDVLINMVKGWLHKEFFDENFLMIVATIGAFIIGEYQEACLVLILYHIGSQLEEYATKKSNKSITNLIKDMPSVVHKYIDENEFIDVEPSKINIDDIVLVQPGERLCLDGVLLSDFAELDESNLTGESLPVGKTKDAKVFSGSINLNTSIMMKVSKEYENSTINEIMRAILDEKNKKAKQENFIKRFAKIYTPIVCVIATLVFIVLFSLNGFNNYQTPLYNALNILIIACPCSLVISIPLSFFMGMGRASKLGVLVKGSSALENMSRINTFCFDKTGTITKGEFTLVNKNEIADETLLIAASLENEISHPLAKAYINESSNRNMELIRTEEFVNYPGYGIGGKINGKQYFVGSEKFVLKSEIEFKRVESPYLISYLFDEEKVIAHFILSDEIKDNAKYVVENLNKDKAKTIMLSGDNENICREVSEIVNFTNYHSSLLPENKLELVNEYKEKGSIIAFIGDGINDSLALSAADVGISMGGLGSDAAIYSSDVVIMNDDLEKIIATRKLSKRVLLLIYENIVFVLLFKLVIMILSAFSISNMILSIASDVGVMIIAILNSLRIALFKYKPKEVNRILKEN